jgi:protein O-GlcNAc transferase
VEGSIVLNVAAGARLCVPRDIGQITPYVLLEQEDWFEAEIRFVRRMLRPGMQAIDVGANHGVYTLAMAGAVGAQGRVWAFEPTPATGDLLQRSLELGGYGQASLSRTALSDRSGTARFNVGKQSELNAIARDGGGPGSIEVKVATLDGLAQELGWRGIDFIKIDAEGHDRDVILGGKSFFERESPLVMFEIASSTEKDVGLAQLLVAQGYRVFYLVPGLLMLAPFDLRAKPELYQLNLFACKIERAESLMAAGLLAVSAAPPGRTPADCAAHALECFQAAHADSRLEPARRLGLLQQAFVSAARALDESESLPHLVTYARAAADLGQRASAFQSFKKAQAMAENRWQDALQKPFLAPSARFDRIPMAGAEREWLACALAEERMRLAYHSSFYSGTVTLPVIEALEGNPFRSPETERRRQLIRMRHGLQDGPEAHPLLATESERNLNAAFWRGLS